MPGTTTFRGVGCPQRGSVAPAAWPSLRPALAAWTAPALWMTWVAELTPPQVEHFWGV